jgi:alkylation response protein AidB-like acyl-CoA dehydrogenase
VLDGLRRLGAFGIRIPKEYGGLGLTTSSTAA